MLKFLRAGGAAAGAMVHGPGRGYDRRGARFAVTRQDEEERLGSGLRVFRPGLVDYASGWRLQQAVADGVRSGEAPALILLEHPPTYTFGTRVTAEHLLLSEAACAARGIEVHRTNRGGDITFHGPGQIVGYPIIDLRALGIGARAYVHALESMLIDVLARFGIAAATFGRNPGVWIGDAKIAAIGVRISRGITTHGFALNVNTDLSYYDGIVACGLRDVGVTSMQACAHAAFEMRDVEDEIVRVFAGEFGFKGVADGVVAAT